jgi:5-methylcytosine-specific restriction endonuclease McrA
MVAPKKKKISKATPKKINKKVSTTKVTPVIEEVRKKVIKLIAKAYTGISTQDIKDKLKVQGIKSSTVLSALRSLQNNRVIVYDQNRGWFIRPNSRPTDTKWSRQRKRIYERDRGICQRCKIEVSFDECHIDHIQPLSLGGTNKDTNLRVLCRVCHALRKDKAHAFLRNTLKKQGLLPKNYRLW